MTMLFSAQNSWIRYFTELSNASNIPSEGSHGTTRVDGADTESGLDFETVLQRTITEYGATKDHLEMLEKKLSKMLEIKEAKAKSDYEIAKKNFALSEKETTLIRQILGREPDVEGRDLEDDDATIKAGFRRHENIRSGTPDHNFTNRNKDHPTVALTPEAEKRAEAILEEYEQLKQQLANEQHLREEAEKSLAANDAQGNVDVAHIRILLKNEEEARKNEEAARLKADGIAAEEARARYTAEQEVQRLRTQIKLISRDKKQSLPPAPVNMSMDNLFAATQGTDGKPPLTADERALQELMEDAAAKAEKKRSGLADSIKKKKLSKRLRSQSVSLGGGPSYDGLAPAAVHPAGMQNGQAY